jgi:hypothetical protein
MTGSPDDRGLDRDGRIRREGSLGQVPPGTSRWSMISVIA